STFDSSLKPQLQPKLELSWIKCCRWLAGIGPEHVYIGYVEFVDEVEHVYRAIELELLGETKCAADPQIGEYCRGLDACIALQIAYERSVQIAGGLDKAGRRIWRGGRDIAAEIHRSVGWHHQRTIGVRTEVKVAIVADQDVEGTSGTGFDDRSNGKSAESLRQKAVAGELPSLVHPTEYEAMTLVEGRF